MESHQEIKTTAGTISAYQEDRNWTTSEEEKAETFTMHLPKIFKLTCVRSLQKEILSDDIRLGSS